MAKTERPRRLHIRRNKSLHPSYNLLGDTVKKAWSKVSQDMEWLRQQKAGDRMVTGVSQEVQDLVLAVRRVYEASIANDLQAGRISQEDAAQSMDLLLQVAMTGDEMRQMADSGEYTPEQLEVLYNQYGSGMHEPAIAGEFLTRYGQHSGIPHFESIGAVLSRVSPPLTVYDDEGNHVLASLDPVTADAMHGQIQRGEYINQLTQAADSLESAGELERASDLREAAQRMTDQQASRAHNMRRAREQWMQQNNIAVDVQANDVESLYNTWAAGGSGLDMVAATFPQHVGRGMKTLSFLLNYGDIAGGAVHRNVREMQHMQEPAPEYHPTLQGLLNYTTTAARLHELEAAGASPEELQQAQQAYQAAVQQVQQSDFPDTAAAMEAAAMHDLTTDAAVVMQRTTSGALLPRFNAVMNAGMKAMQEGVPETREEAIHLYGDIAGRAIIEAKASQAVARRTVEPLRRATSTAYKSLSGGVSRATGTAGQLASKWRERLGRRPSPAGKVERAARLVQQVPNAATSPGVARAAQSLQEVAPTPRPGMLRRMSRIAGRTAGRVAGPLVGAADLYEGHTDEGRERIDLATKKLWADQFHNRGMGSRARRFARGALSVPEAMILGGKDHFQAMTADAMRTLSPNLRQARQEYWDELGMSNQLLEQYAQVLPQIERAMPGVDSRTQRHLASAAAANIVDVQAGRTPAERQYNELDDQLMQAIQENVGGEAQQQVRSLMELAGPEALAEVFFEPESGRVRRDVIQSIGQGEPLDTPSPFHWTNPFDERRRQQQLEQQQQDHQQQLESEATSRQQEEARWQQQRQQQTAEMEQRQQQQDADYQRVMQEVEDSSIEHHQRQQSQHTPAPNPATTADDQVEHWQHTGRWDQLPEQEQQQWSQWAGQSRPAKPPVDLGAPSGDNVPTPTVRPQLGS